MNPLQRPLACPSLLGAVTHDGLLVVGAVHNRRSRYTKTLLLLQHPDTGMTSNSLSHLTHFKATNGNVALLTNALCETLYAKKGEVFGLVTSLVKGSRFHLYGVRQSEGLGPLMYWKLPHEGMSSIEALEWVLTREVQNPTEAFYHEDRRGPVHLVPFKG